MKALTIGRTFLALALVTTLRGGGQAQPKKATYRLGLGHRGNVSRRGGSPRDRYERPLIIARDRAREEFDRY